MFARLLACSRICLTFIPVLDAGNRGVVGNAIAGCCSLEGVQQAAPQNASELVRAPTALVQGEAAQTLAGRRCYLHPAHTYGDIVSRRLELKSR